MADPRIRISYPDGNVRIVALPVGPCADGKVAHKWAARVDHPTDASNAPLPGVVTVVGAECSVCHGAVGETLHPPLEGDVTAEII